MFGNMGNMGNIMKQAAQMQQRIAEMQQKIHETDFTGQAGNGAVTVTMTGKGVTKAVKLKPEAVDPNDIETLEDLIMLAMNDVRNQIDTFSDAESQKAMGGMKLPAGMKLPF